MRELQLKIYATLLPFAFGPEWPHECDPIRSATCSAVQTEGGAFLLTANHVLEEALRTVHHSPDALCAVGVVEFPLRIRASYCSKAFDVATIPLTADELDALERDGRNIIRPTQWPPRLAANDEPIIFGGFPKAMRNVESWQSGTLSAVTSAGYVTACGEDWFSYRGDPDDMAQFDVATGEEENILEKLDGVSGGPVFRIQRQSNQVLFELVGVVSEGSVIFGHHAFTFARRLDIIAGDGRITRPSAI